ncbi:cuticle protein 67-like [Musca vetustissima]|uniref:cuticle protein 67-like n=1 Tax=Musca vetustissima TaxID=27455 RepID=UPI002AB68BD6|nr:cuticle protein 67-like [Musca vetustissima]
MAFKFVAFFALLAVANAGYVAPVTTYAAAPVLTKVVNPSVDAVASTQQNVVRSFAGTVSHYSKSVNTPYSSVNKVDTRINNNVYTPAVAKTVSYAAPAVHNYAAAAPAVHTYAAAAPAVHTYAAAAPAFHTYAAAPAVYAHGVPAAAPVVKHAITYSPAETVAHVNFDAFGAHWGY